MSEKISPLPWVSLSPVDFDSIRLFSGNNYIGCIGCSDGPRETTEANANYIVRCVNAYAGLVEALEKATKALHHLCANTALLIELDAALAQAKT
jgi:hypothetical protein